MPSCLLFAALLISATPCLSRSAPVEVRIDPVTGLTRNGQPYFVKGAGGSGDPARLAALGANSLRTWSTDDLDKVLDSAARHGLTVSAGIWLESECSWFSYHNPEHCARQGARVREQILKFKDHPALLAWGIGNEAEGDGADPAFWQQIDRLAVMTRELDPAHPCFTAVAGLSAAKAEGMNRHAPHLDFVGINTYGALPGLRKSLTEIKWTRPWLVTEWGPQGFWERPRGAGGLALEQTSSEKAGMMAAAYDAAIAPGGACLGSYVFIWGWKYEGSVTWFGLLTDQGDTTAAVDLLEQRWSGKAPANSAPRIAPLTGIPAGPVKPGTLFTVRTTASDPDNDPLTWRWAVLPESTNHDAGVHPPMPDPVPDTLTDPSGPSVSGRAPTRPGRYRVHVWARDGKGHAATANLPLVVE